MVLAAESLASTRRPPPYLRLHYTSTAIDTPFLHLLLMRSQSSPCSAHCYYLLHPHAPACAPPAADSTRHSTCGGSNFCHSSAVCAISARVSSAPFGSSTTKPAPRRLHAYWLAAPVSRRPKRLASSRLPTSPNMTLLAETCPPVTSSSIRPGSPTRCYGRGNGSRETG